MSYDHRRRRRSISGSTFLVPGYACLAAMKAADVVTTAVGLTVIPGLVEMNPLARTLFGEVGTITGLVALGGLLVLGVALFLELLITSAYRYTGSPILPVILRVGGYGSLSMMYGLAAVHNASLIVDRLVAFSVIP